jgi:hypothetical protein
LRKTRLTEERCVHNSTPPFNSITPNEEVVTLRIKTLLCSSIASLLVGCAGSEADFVDAAEIQSSSQELVASSYRISLRTSQGFTGGQRGALYFNISDRRGAAVNAFELEHTKLFHLILVSADLAYFQHLHPVQLSGGGFGVNWTPPRFSDDYLVYAQFKPVGAPLQTILLPLHVNGTAPKIPVALRADTTSTKSDGTNLLMLERPAGGFRAGAQKLSFMVHDARTGQMADDLGTFLGAKAHLIAVKAQASGQVFLHGHDMGGEPMPGGGHGGHEGHLEGSSTPGQLSFDVDLPSAGLYRIWVQYNRAGANVTQSFVIQVGAGSGGTAPSPTPHH